MRESLEKDRVRVNLGIASKDIGFLDDQLGPRLQAMSNKTDHEFAMRKAANLKRESSSVPQPGPSAGKSPSTVDDDTEDDDETEQVEQMGDNNEDYVDKSRREKISDRITVSIPRNVFMTPELISSLDHCKASRSWPSVTCPRSGTNVSQKKLEEKRSKFLTSQLWGIFGDGDSMLSSITFRHSSLPAWAGMSQATKMFSDI